MKRSLFNLFLITCLITSCQKEIGTTENPVINNDSTLISMYVELDTTLISPADTLSKILFTYDNLKRISRLQYFTYHNGLIVPADSHESRFLYNSSDTLPYKEIENGIDPFSSLPYVVNKFLHFCKCKVGL